MTWKVGSADADSLLSRLSGAAASVPGVLFEQWSVQAAAAAAVGLLEPGVLLSEKTLEGVPPEVGLEAQALAASARRCEEGHALRGSWDLSACLAVADAAMPPMRVASPSPLPKICGRKLMGFCASD